MEGFLKRLEEIRNYFGLSIRGMSTHLGLGFSTWHQYERGKREPSTQAMLSLARQNININWLLTGQGQMLVEGTPTPPRTEEQSNALRLSEIISKIRATLDGKIGRRLRLWEALTQELAQHEDGLTPSELLKKLGTDYTDEELNRELQLLQREGIAGESKGKFRLIRAYISNNTTDIELRMLMMTKELLEVHLPVFQNAESGRQLVSWKVYVGRNASVNHARQLVGSVRAWQERLSSVKTSDSQDEIRVLMSIVCISKKELPS